MTDDRPPLKEVDHTHPNATETVTEMYRRGPSVSDGSGDADGDAPDTTIGDVDHVAPDDLSPNDVFDRGRDAVAADAADTTDGDDTDDVDETIEVER